MKNILIIFFAAFIFISQSLPAQTENTERQGITDSSSALQFQIGSSFTLSSFQGSTISFKHHLEKSSALRLGLSLSFYGMDGRTDRHNVFTDTTSSDSKEGADDNSNEIQLNLQYIRYINPWAKLLVYTGGGPLVLFINRSRSGETSNLASYIEPRKTHSEEKMTGWGAGFTALAGVEWFAASGISLMAEYHLTGIYIWRKSDFVSENVNYTSKTTATTKDNYWSISGEGVRFGLNVYFR